MRRAFRHLPCCGWRERNCRSGSQATFDEVGWNHLFQHTRKYTVADPLHTDMWDWWVPVHHNIGIGSAGQVTITSNAAQNANASSVAAFLDGYFPLSTPVAISPISLCSARRFGEA